MHIQLTNTGKRFNREWIFRGFNYEFVAGKKYAITGPNGSGKSTLLQVIAGAVAQSEGNITYRIGNETCAPEIIYRHVSIAAPYLELVEEMTTTELLEFHSGFKPLQLSIKEIISIVGLEKAAHKQIRNFSSGMKQRLKLAQAFFTDSPVLLIDEPSTNLDAEGITLYHQLIDQYTTKKLLIISSNDKAEYQACDEVIEIINYKDPI